MVSHLRRDPARSGPVLTGIAIARLGPCWGTRHRGRGRSRCFALFTAIAVAPPARSLAAADGAGCRCALPAVVNWSSHVRPDFFPPFCCSVRVLFSGRPGRRGRRGTVLVAAPGSAGIVTFTFNLSSPSARRGDPLWAGAGRCWSRLCPAPCRAGLEPVRRPGFFVLVRSCDCRERGSGARSPGWRDGFDPRWSAGRWARGRTRCWRRGPGRSTRARRAPRAAPAPRTAPPLTAFVAAPCACPPRSEVEAALCTGAAVGRPPSCVPESRRR